MPNREISTETKVKVMEECLSLVNVETTAADYGVSPGAIYYWDKKLKSKLKEILVNDLPGPKPEVQFEPNKEGPEAKADRPTECPECGGNHNIFVMFSNAGPSGKISSSAYPVAEDGRSGAVHVRFEGRESRPTTGSTG